MTKILVPTDFSDLSQVAIRYALRFAATIDAEIVLLHVVDIVEPATAAMRTRLKPVEKELLETARHTLQMLASGLETANPKQLISIRVVKGHRFAEIVIKEARKVRAGLIIMGTRGASGLKKYIVGSNTASVIEVSHLPVLVVPERAEFGDLRTIVYATDLTRTDKELKILMPYFSQSEAIVHLVHITSSAKQIASLEQKVDAIVAKAGASNVIVRILASRNVGEAIDTYVRIAKADLLATFTHEHGFYEKLFDRSLTRKIAFQSKIPLLAFRQVAGKSNR